MSVQVQLRRDTLANVKANHGAIGEVFISTDTNGLFIQDGMTNGGFTPNGTSPARAAVGIDASNVPHGGNVSIACQEELLSGFSGATKVSTITLPVGAIVLGVSVRVTTAITGAGSFQVDPTTDLNIGGAFAPVGKFGNPVAIALNTTNPGIIVPAAVYFSSTITLTGRNAANTANANFTAGAVRVQLNYMPVNPPTS